MASITVVIPAYNSGAALTRCLRALSASTMTPLEVIVVDDGSTDDTRKRAGEFATRVLETGGPRGPGFARNLGAREAVGSILFFLDSDVCVRQDTVERMCRRFEADPTLDAVIGSYDTTPGNEEFLSQYRNLMHAYFHQTGHARASTFWSGCGAIRKQVFASNGGFDESARRPSIEDIELGYRLIQRGHNVLLDREIQVTHLKRWTFWNIVKTDILDRGIPWTELILRSQFMPNDLNLRFSQRISVVLVATLAAIAGRLAMQDGAALLVPLMAILFFLLAGWWSEIGASGTRSDLAVLSCVPIVLAAEAYRRHIFGLVAPLVFFPGLLLLLRWTGRQRLRPAWLYWLRILYVAASLLVAALCVPAHPLTLVCFAIIALLALLNADFYVFLSDWRGMLFMLATVPMHLLYHFYNGFSFLIGFTRHCYFGALGAHRHPLQQNPFRLHNIGDEER